MLHYIVIFFLFLLACEPNRLELSDYLNSAHLVTNVADDLTSHSVICSLIIDWSDSQKLDLFSGILPGTIKSNL